MEYFQVGIIIFQGLLIVYLIRAREKDWDRYKSRELPEAIKPDTARIVMKPHNPMMAGMKENEKSIYEKYGISKK